MQLERTTHSPPHIPVQASGVDLVLGFAETHIQDRRTMLELLQQLPFTDRSVLIPQIVNIHILIPR